MFQDSRALPYKRTYILSNKKIACRRWDLNHILMWDKVSTLYQLNKFLLVNSLNLVHETDESNLSWKLSLLTKSKPLKRGRI